ncbi:myotrophin isoform X1 [Musca domestica]|uniref:Myotrophin isoform X1 n=2 Tax=Musca domestica TaxID=7370 RepID=A0ABM3VJU9_MUSDO|nr:myotrophin isoform X1 [Musca domestica]
MSDIIWSIKNGELDQVQSVFAEKSSAVNSEYNGRYPIHYAADYGQHEVLEYLISMGAKLDVKDKHGITPLLAAIWEGHTQCVKLLLERHLASYFHRPSPSELNIWSNRTGYSSPIGRFGESTRYSPLHLHYKGADKNGKTPDGKSYTEAAEKDEIRNLLR